MVADALGGLPTLVVAAADDTADDSAAVDEGVAAVRDRVGLPLLAHAVPPIAINTATASGTEHRRRCTPTGCGPHTRPDHGRRT
jgi:hypothetical protein